MPMRLEIVTAERILFEGEVDVVVAPGGDGELGVLPHHAAVMTTLLPGELRYRVGSEETHYIVHGGFMDVRGDQVVVLADAAEHINEIDEARVEEAIARAQERIAARGEDVDLERALASLRRGQIRLNITRRRRRQRPNTPASTPE
jgi:F-type H+-transporting ATPase subunit epsilon